MVIEGVGPFSTVACLYLCLSNYMEKVWRSMKKMSLLGADLTWQRMAAVSDSSLLISGQRSPNPPPHSPITEYSEGRRWTMLEKGDNWSVNIVFMPPPSPHFGRGFPTPPTPVWT